MTEAGKVLDEALARFEERFFNGDETPPTPLSVFLDDLFHIAIRYGSVEGITRKVEEEWVVVFTLPGGAEQIVKPCYWFRGFLASLAFTVAGIIWDEEKSQYVLEGLHFTEEEVTAEFQRLRLIPELPDDTAYDIKARRNRVLRSLQESPLGAERAKHHEERQINLYGFSVTVDYFLDGDNQYRFTLRR